MKTPDEIKKGLKCSSIIFDPACSGDCASCEYHTPNYPLSKLDGDALAYIQQLETSYGQVAKALGCKENASADELVYTVMQISKVLANANEQLEMARAEREATNKNRIALMIELSETKRERDAAVNDLPHNCWNCKYHRGTPIEEIDTGGRTIHRYCDADYCYPDEENSSWQWRGVCPENTKEQKA